MGDAAALGKGEKQYKSLDDVIIPDSVHMTKFVTNIREIPPPHTNGILSKQLKR
jgi:type IV secretory pathway TrbF-like protein